MIRQTRPETVDLEGDGFQPTPLSAPQDGGSPQAVPAHTRNLRHRLVQPLLVCSVLVYLALVLVRGDAIFAHGDPIARLFDEGVAVTGAARILSGEIPYRDFWAFYGPGHFYTLAGLFKLFGTSLAVERIWDLSVRLALSLTVYLLVAGLTTPRVALVPLAFTALWLGTANFYGYVMFPTLLLALLSSLCLLRSVTGNSSAWLAMSGVLAGFTTAYRHDIGFFTVAAHLIMMILVKVKYIDAHYGNGIDSKLLRIQVPYMLGFCAAVFPILFFLIVTVPLNELWYTFVVFPLTVFKPAHSLPIPPLSPDFWLHLIRNYSFELFLRFLFFVWVPFYTPIFIYVISTCVIVWFVYKSRPIIARKYTVYGLALITLQGASLFNQAINRADEIHLVPTSILGIMSITISLYLLRVSTIRRSHARWVGLVLFLLAPYFVGLPIYKSFAISSDNKAEDCAKNADTEIERAGCTYVFPFQSDAILLIQQITGPDDRIFVGNATHDRIEANDAMFYFLSGRKNGTSFDDLVSAQAGTLITQNQIIGELEGRDVRYVVLSSVFSGESRQRPDSNDSGATLLDGYIRSEYRLVRDFGFYSVWGKQ